MKLHLDKDDLQSALEEFTLEMHGDKYEREFGHYVTHTFPNCGRFWKAFVVPQTQRIEPTSERGSAIRFRANIDSELKHIAMAHYSMFFHLVYAHLHLEKPQLFSFEDTYVHLASACGLADEVLSHWSLILLECQGKRSKMFEDLSRDEFLDKAGNWYDKYYEDTRTYYLSKGRTRPIRLVSERHLLKEYLGDTPHWPRYFKETSLIHVYRSLIIHDVRLGRILPTNATSEEYLVPRPEQVRGGRYRTWEEVQEVASNENIVKQHFIERYELATESLSTLEQLLNDVWGKLIDDFAEEFYHSERDSLRKMFRIGFSDNPRRFQIQAIVEELSRSPGVSEDFEAGFATATSDSATGPSDILTRGSADFSDLWDELPKDESEGNDE